MIKVISFIISIGLLVAFCMTYSFKKNGWELFLAVNGLWWMMFAILDRIEELKKRNQ